MDLRLFVIEPEALRRRLVCESCDGLDGLEVVGSATSLLDADVAAAADPDLFLVDVCLVSSERGALGSVARRYPGASFVLFGSNPDLSALLGSVQVPVRGFLAFNHLTGEEFARSLQVIAYGGAVIEPLCAQMLLDYLQTLTLPATLHGSTSNGHFDAATELTDREQEVLALVREGLGNKEIARRLSISLGTVRAHLRSIFRRLDVTSRAGAAASSKASTVISPRRRLVS